MSTNSSAQLSSQQQLSYKRLVSIDCVRGLMMLFMLLDHVRERFLYHQQVADPINIDVTEPALFFTRLLAHLCAPIFVLLTGLSAWLYAHPFQRPPRNAAEFLLKRGMILILIELTLVNLSWFGNYEFLFLQVIWAIGWSMISLGFLCRLPRGVLFAVGVVIVAGHNLLTPLSFPEYHWAYELWAILHDRGVIFDGFVVVKASYPVLPWIGVILLGYCLGPIFSQQVESEERRRFLMIAGIAALALLLVLRGFNIYGETLPWQQQTTLLYTVMDFFNYTKYPPSLDYLLLTLGTGALLLAVLEHRDNRLIQAVATFGSAPMFFYVFHLYVLLLGYKIMMVLVGANYGQYYAFDHVGYVWLVTVILAVVLYFPTVAFARFKQKTSLGWVKYF